MLALQKSQGDPPRPPRQPRPELSPPAEAIETLEAMGDHLVTAHQLIRRAAEMAADLPITTARQSLPWLMQLAGMAQACAVSTEQEIQYRRALEDTAPPVRPHRSPQS